MRMSSWIAMGVLSVGLGSPALQAQTTTAVAGLDENRLTGTWHEVARLPNKSQKHCVGNATELTARGDKSNQLLWVQTCKTKNDIDSRNMTAKPQNKKSTSFDGKLKVTTIFPFTQKYWVLAIDDANAWLLIGSPNHKALWIYAKSSILAPNVLASIQAKATMQGFDASKLVITPPSKL